MEKTFKIIEKIGKRDDEMGIITYDLTSKDTDCDFIKVIPIEKE